MPDKVNLNNISIVLYKPRFPENIGSAARAMQNMGIKNLIVVEPENCDLTKMLKMATHSAADIIQEMLVYETLSQAIDKFSYVVGTTARLGGERPVVKRPSVISQDLVSITQNNPTAILFGPEDKGLTNKEIKYCQSLLNIPTAEFSSLNLSQAVMIICYELFIASMPDTQKFLPRLANTNELEAMYDQLQDIFIRISFINHENPDHWMLNLRRFFGRLNLRARDVKIIRGICRQIDWYTERRFKNK